MGVNFDPEGITQTIDITDVRKYKGKWNTRKEYETVKVVRDRFVRMQLGRRTCWPYASLVTDMQAPGVNSGSNDGVSTGSDAVAAWNQSLKQWSMWHEYVDGRSNLKSPTTYAPIESALAEFMDNQTKVTLTATHEEDEKKAFVYERVIDHLFNSAVLQKANNETFKNTLIYGSAISYVGWVRKEREVELIMSSRDTEKELKGKKKKDEIKKSLDEGRPLTKKSKIVEYDDIAIVPVSLYEFFPDPDARCMRGPAYEAVDCIWRTIPSLEQFRAEFTGSNDPWVIKANIDKVYPAYVAERMYTEGLPFFRAPTDIARKNKVELIRYYNKQTDKYIIIANDVLIREGPLPYNHKQLPFVLHKLIDFPDMFWGIGLPVLLESNQAEDETLRNMSIDQLKLATNPPIAINSMVFADIDQQWERTEPGMKLNVDGDVGPGSIRVIEMPGARPDYFNMHGILSEDAIQITGINPIMSAMPKSNVAVRTNMLLMESGLKHVRKYTKNWAFGYTDAIRQVIMLIKQFYPDAYTEEYDKEGKMKERKYKRITIEGKQLIEKDGKMEEYKIDGNSYFEVKGEYLDLTGDLEVEVDIDALLPMSRTVKMQKIEAAMAQLIPIMANPALKNQPGVTELIQEYIKTHELSSELSSYFADSNSEDDVKYAEEQEQQMIKGVVVPGIPGESQAHKMHHLQTIEGIKAELAEKGMDAEPELVNTATQFMMKLIEHAAMDDQEPDFKSGMSKIGPQGQMLSQGPMGQAMTSGPQLPQGFAPQGPQGMPTTPEGGVQMPPLPPMPQ